jgi:ATP/maltotriose-dependent transcriptional regulator MalT
MAGRGNRNRADPIMSREPIIATKLVAPPTRAELVSRARLRERLDLALTRRLTLVSAPPGFGKTTLLSQWRRARNGGGTYIAWLSVDEADNDLHHFLHYLAAAVDASRPGIGDQALNVLRTPSSSVVNAVLTAIINEVGAADAEFALILDDYDRIESDAVHRALSFLIDHLPERMHIVIAARHDPPLFLARLRATDQLLELRASDLRFNPAESAEFLNNIMGLGLTAQDLEALDDVVAGWVVGLQLAALALEGRDSPVAILAEAFSGSHRYVVGYLAEEVLQRLPLDLQTFLLHTSVLDTLSPAACVAVSGDECSQSILDELQTRNLFIEPADEAASSYRYHPLFADFLRSRFQQQDPSGFSEAHLRASAWYEQEADMVGAVNHALAGNDLARTVELLEASAPEMVRQLDWRRLANWLSALPDDLLLSRPRLSVTYARALAVLHQPDAALRLLPRIETRARDEEDVLTLGGVKALRAYIAARTEDHARAVELCQDALAMLPATANAARSNVLWTLGSSYELGGDLRSAGEAYGAAVEVSQAGGFAPNLLALVDLGYAQFEQGQLRDGEALFRRVLSPGNERLAASPVLGVAHSELGELCRERNQLDEANDHLQTALELLRPWGNLLALIRAYRYLGKMWLARGDVAAAIRSIEEGEALAEAQGVPAGNLKAAKARFWLAAGDVESAARWARESGLGLDDDLSHLSHLKELEYVALACILGAEGNRADSLDLLTRLRAAAAAAGRGRNLVQIIALQSLALDRLGRNSQASLALEDALTLAEPEGYVRTFLDQGQPMAALLTRFRADESHRSPVLRYARALIADFAAEAKVQVGVAALGNGLLSRREHEVLALLSDGLSNQDIADEIVVSQGTVKRHVHNIFRKLNVHSRTQALARARELRLLPA